MRCVPAVVPSVVQSLSPATKNSRPFTAIRSNGEVAPGATVWMSPMPPDVIRNWPPCEKKSRSPAAVSTPTMSPIDELALPGVRSAMRTVPPVVPSVR